MEPARNEAAGGRNDGSGRVVQAVGEGGSRGRVGGGLAPNVGDTG